MSVVVYDEQNGIRSGLVQVPPNFGLFGAMCAVTKDLLVIFFPEKFLTVVDVTRFKIIWHLEINAGDFAFAANRKVYLLQSGFIKILSADVGEKVAEVQLPNIFHDYVRFVSNRPHPLGSVEDKVTWIPYVVVRLSTGRHAVYTFNVETYDVLKVDETNQMIRELDVSNDKLIFWESEEGPGNQRFLKVFGLPSCKLIYTTNLGHNFKFIKGVGRELYLISSSLMAEIDDNVFDRTLKIVKISGDGNETEMFRARAECGDFTIHRGYLIGVSSNDQYNHDRIPDGNGFPIVTFSRLVKDTEPSLVYFKMEHFPQEERPFQPEHSPDDEDEYHLHLSPAIGSKLLIRAWFNDFFVWRVLEFNIDPTEAVEN